MTKVQILPRALCKILRSHWVLFSTQRNQWSVWTREASLKGNHLHPKKRKSTATEHSRIPMALRTDPPTMVHLISTTPRHPYSTSMGLDRWRIHPVTFRCLTCHSQPVNRNQR